MGILELILLSVGLAMDAFAVSITEGFLFKSNKNKYAFIVAFSFGVSQAIMPLIGYFLGYHFHDAISEYDHWIAFILLSLIGLKMIYERFKKDNGHDNIESYEIDILRIITLAIATSIDALVIGLSFAFLNVQIVPAIICIGLITFIISLFGVKMGYYFGNKFKKQAELFGGIILILIGLRILLGHLNIIVL